MSNVTLAAIDPAALSKLANALADAIKKSSSTGKSGSDMQEARAAKASKNKKQAEEERDYEKNVRKRLAAERKTRDKEHKEWQEETKKLFKQLRKDAKSTYTPESQKKILRKQIRDLKAEQKLKEETYKQDQESLRLQRIAHAQAQRALKARLRQTSAAGKLTSDYVGSSEAIRQHSKEIKTSYDALARFGGGLDSTIRQQSSVLSGLIDSSELSSDAQENHTDKLFKTAASLRVFSRYIDNTATSARDLDEAQQKLAKEIDFFERLMENTEQPISEYINYLQDTLELGERTLTAQEELALEYARNAELVGQDSDAYAEHVRAARADITVLRNTASSNIALNQVTHHLIDHFGAFGQVLSGQLGGWGALTAGLGMLMHGIEGVWDQLKMIGEAGFFGSILAVKKAQMSLGLSAEQVTKLFQENARILGSANMGMGRYVDILEQTQNGLMRYGVKTEDAAEAAAEFTKNAVRSGISLKNSEALNKALQSQTKYFGLMHATTGATIAEFKAMNEEMLTNSSVQSELNSVGKDERASRVDQMMKLRQSFIQMGMSAQTAQKALMAIKDQGHQKVTTRFEQAAKLQQSAGIAGLSNAAQLGNIARKHDINRSTEERQALVNGIAAITKFSDRAAGISFGANNIGDAVMENISEFQALIDAGREQKLAADSISQMSEKTANAMTKLSEIPETMARAIKLESQFKAVVTDPMVDVLKGIGLTTAGILLLMTSRGAGGIFAGLRGMLTGAGSAAGGIEAVLPAIGTIARFAGKLGLWGGIAAGAFGTISDSLDADNLLGLGPTQTATMSQRLAVGVVGALKGITFGMFDDVFNQFDKDIGSIDFASSVSILTEKFSAKWQLFTLALGTTVDIMADQISQWVNQFVDIIGNMSHKILSGIASMLPDSVKAQFPGMSVGERTNRAKTPDQLALEATMREDEYQQKKSQIQASSLAKIEALRKNAKAASTAQATSAIMAAKMTEAGQVTNTGAEAYNPFTGSISAAGLISESAGGIVSPTSITPPSVNNNTTSDTTNGEGAAPTPVVNLSDSSISKIVEQLTTLTGIELQSLNIEKLQLVALQDIATGTVQSVAQSFNSNFGSNRLTDFLSK